MPELCNFCYEPVDRDGDSTWQQVVGWVGGPKKNGLTQSEKTGNFAHDECIKKAQAGQAPQQETLFDMPEAEVRCSDHKPVQHRDGMKPWCHQCGLTAEFHQPLRSFPKGV